MARLRSKNRFIQDFGGVALADILANGVVVLLVVIIMTISFKKQQTEEQIEQSVEISAILARDIASSLVFNDLPSSPPAILHNYQCRSPRGPWRNHYAQHDCMPWLYPIFELHKDSLREFNSNRIFTREQLLEEDNELDAYLRLLTPVQKQRARIDIYDVGIYYLALSILRENGVRPGHWHFLGEGRQPPSGGGGSLADFIGGGNNHSLAEGLEGDGEETGEDEQTGDPQTGEQQTGNQPEQEIPADTSLRAPDLNEGMLPPSLSRGGELYDQRLQLESEFEGDGEDSYSDAFAEALANAILDEEEGSSVFGAPSSLRIRIPTGSGEEGSIAFPELFDSIGSAEGTPIEYHIFMILYLLEYIRLVDELGFDRVDANELATRLLSGAINLDNHPQRAFAESLKEQMRQAFEAGEGPIDVNQQQCDYCETQLYVLPNQPVNEVRLHSLDDSLGGETPFVNLEMRLYPYPDNGQLTELFKGDTLLVHPLTTRGKKWYAAAILDPNIEDVVIGYVYGDEIEDALAVYADVNSLRLAGQRLVSSLPNFPLRNEVILIIVYTSLAIFILLVFFFFLSLFIRQRSANA